MKIAYLAHPVSRDVPGNLAKAKVWLQWLQKRYPDRAFIAPWIDWIEYCGDDDNDPVQRELGMECDFIVVSRCHEFWPVGGRMSAGMQREKNVAIINGVDICDQFLRCEVPPRIITEEELIQMNVEDALTAKVVETNPDGIKNVVVK